jgi:hypothetical protein
VKNYKDYYCFLQDQKLHAGLKNDISRERQHAAVGADLINKFLG